MSGQHVGSAQDRPGQAEDLAIARANARAIEALKRPVERVNGPKHDYGDGDRCPSNPEHGKMFVLKGDNLQYCANRVHDGQPASAPGGQRQATRSLWPYQSDSFAAAVAAWKETQNG